MMGACCSHVIMLCIHACTYLHMYNCSTMSALSSPSSPAHPPPRPPHIAHQVLGTLHLLHSACVALKILQPRLRDPAAGPKQTLSMLILNSACLALACSTYYGFCGNHAQPTTPIESIEGDWAASGGLKRVVCSREAWYRPVVSVAGAPVVHPTLPWMLFGETQDGHHHVVNASSIMGMEG